MKSPRVKLAVSRGDFSDLAVLSSTAFARAWSPPPARRNPPLPIDRLPLTDGEPLAAPAYLPQPAGKDDSLRYPYAVFPPGKEIPLPQRAQPQHRRVVGAHLLPALAGPFAVMGAVRADHVRFAPKPYRPRRVAAEVLQHGGHILNEPFAVAFSFKKLRAQPVMGPKRHRLRAAHGVRGDRVIFGRGWRPAGF